MSSAIKMFQTIGTGLNEMTLVNKVIKSGKSYGIFRNDFLDIYCVVNIDNGSYEFGGTDNEKTCLDYICENL